MKSVKSSIASIGCLFLIGAAFCQIAAAQIFNPIFNQAFSLAERNPPAATDLPVMFDRLTEQARRDGSVKVIVGFKVENYRQDAELGRVAQDRQRADIKDGQASILNRLQNFAVVNPKQFDYIPFMAMEISADALEVLRQSPEVVSIEEDAIQYPMLPQSIPLLGGSPFGSSTGGTFGGFSGAGRTVAVLDTGVDKFHPFFNNRVVSEACFSTTGGTLTSVCPGGASQSTAAGSGVNCAGNIDGCDHGTHVAGIAAGGHPQISGNGVARNANIIAVQVFSRTTDCGSNPSPCTRSANSDSIMGLERVYALRSTYQIDAVNMSLGGGQYFGYCDSQFASYKTAIDNLRAAGIATLIASGNDGYTNSMASPACISTAISVGSTNDGDTYPIDFVSSFSNSASFLNLLAPGETILSSVPGGSYEDSQGTSQATPMVAGAWAVMKQKFPSDTIAQTLTRLRYGGVQVLDSRNGFVKPRIKLDTALNTSNVDPCSASPTTINFGQTVNGSLGNADCLLSLGNRVDLYTFNGTQGQGVAMTLSSGAFFNYLYLLNSSGQIIGQNGNGNTSRIPASGFLTLPATGIYYIYATSVEGNKFGNYTLSLTTNAPTCNFTITSTSQSFAAAGGAGSFGVNAPAGCAWTAQSDAAWLTTSSSGSGSGTINYSVAQNTSTSPRTGTISIPGQTHTVTQAGAVAPPAANRRFDFDGDGKADVSVFRPSNGTWYLQQSQNGFTGINFGLSGDKIAPADYDGDGKTDVAVFRNGTWYLNRSQLGFTGISFGTSGDIPQPADYDGDGKADVAVFRPSNGTWYLLQSQLGFTGINFGLNGDKPVAADYDGDGKADVAVFRNGTWYLNRSQLGFTGIAFGIAEDKPVPADYDGDGKTDVAVFRPSNAAWYLNRSQLGFTGIQFGISTDAPVPADYDGDGKADVSVYRGGTWYLNRSTAGFTGVAFGIDSDKPIPNAYVN